MTPCTAFRYAAIRGCVFAFSFSLFPFVVCLLLVELRVVPSGIRALPRSR